MDAKKRVIGIALLTGLAILGDSMLLIVLPIYWQEFGLTSIWQIGIILSVNRFIRLPINPLVGLFYKKFQLRTGLYFAMCLAILSTLFYGISKSFLLLVLLRAVWGIAWSFLRLGGYLTVIEVSSNANRGKFVGLYNGLWGLGGLVGMLGGGILVDQTSIIFVTSLFAILGIIGFPLIVSYVPKSPKAIEADDSNSKGSTKFTPYVWMVLCTGLTMGFIVFGLLATTLSQLVERSFTTDWTFVGITIGAASIAGIIQALKWSWDPFVASFIGRRLDSSKDKIRLLVISLMIGGFLSLALGFTQIFALLFVVLLAFQLFSTMFVTTTDTLATNAASMTNNSIKVVTAYTIVVDVGAALGPFLSYLVIEFISIAAVYVISCIALLSLAFAWSIFQRMNKPLQIIETNNVENSGDYV